MNHMSTLQEIETAIDRLSPEEYEALLTWMDSRPQPIDVRLKADLESGRMDDLIERAKADYEAGHTTPL